MAKVAIALGDSAKQVLVSTSRGKLLNFTNKTMRWTSCIGISFSVLIDREWKHSIAAGVETALLGRFYERFADHAVEIGRRAHLHGQRCSTY